MAYPVQGSWKEEYTNTFTAATGVTLASDNWPDHAIDDVITIVATQDGGTAVLSCATSGWVRQGTRTGNPAGGVFGQVFTKVAASARVGGVGGETIPTITSNINDRMTLVAFCIRDADTTTPIDVVSAQTDWNNVAAADSATPTATSDDSLAIYTWHSDGSAQFHADIFEASQLGQFAGTGLDSVSVAYRQLGAAGAVPAATMHLNIATEGGTSWVVVFKNKSGGKLAPDVFWSGSRINYYGNFSVALSEAPTWYALEQATHQFSGGFTAATLDGLSVSSSAVTNTANNTAGANYAVGQATTISCTENTAGMWVGMWHEIASKNMDGKFFSVELSSSGAKALNSNRYGFKGGLIGFTDGTNYALFRTFNGRKRWSANTPYNIVIACGRATPIYSRGTLNWGAITGIAYLIHREGSSATAESLYPQNAFLFDSMALVGGSSAVPAIPSDVPMSLSPSGYRDLTLLQSSAQAQIKVPFQIGDGGTHKTVFAASAASIEYPQAFSDVVVPNWQVTWSVPANAAGVTVYAGASDSINFAAALLATDTAQAFTIHASSSTSASYSFAGASFVGWNVTWKSGINANLATFKRCGEIDAKGSDWTDCTITGTASTDAAIAFSEDGGSLTRCTLDVTGTSAAHHLELGTAVTAITLADVTFTGTPGTDKVHVLKTTGTVTITISGTTSLAAGDVTSEGATVDIIAPELFQTVTITNLVAGSRVQIYDTTGSTELANEVAAGTSVVWTDADPAVSSRAIRVRIAYVSGVTAKHFVEQSIGTCGVTEGTEAVTYLANQTDDDVYVTNAIDGSAVAGVTFTDAATDLVNVNVPGGTISWGQIYAATAYWLFGAVGITNDIAMIDAPDPANYRFSAMKVKNTSSGPVVPLTITGGYGYDATSGSIADVIDTSAGSIFPMPDHVVSKVVTVAGGDVITGDIATVLAAIPSSATNAAAVLSAATSTPIHANIKQVNSLSVDGTGTEADPWGPV